MTSYLEKWPHGFAWRPSAPLPLLLEAVLELLALGTAAASLAAAGMVPLSSAGLAVAALSYAGVALFIVSGLRRHAPHSRFGLANAITLCRAAFNIVLLTVVAEELLGKERLMDVSFRWGLTAAAIFALALDGADGWTARRTKMTSEFGARFDVETDGVFMLALSLLLATGGIVGPWVVACGAIYYVFRLAGKLWPPLSALLFPSMRRKTICVAQGALLIAAMTPSMPGWGAQWVCVIGIALLIYSFGVDLVWLIRQPSSAASGDRFMQLPGPAGGQSAQL